jgi:rare lipoprotein A
MDWGDKRGTLARAARFGATAAACLALAHCSGGTDKFGRTVDPRYGVAASPRVVAPGEPVPKGGGAYRVGRPYTVGGRTYVPEEDVNYRAEGLASWYGPDFHGRQTANGEVFDMHSISAAHPTLPMPSYARVTNLANGRSIIVRVNDRGPYHANRVIDLSIKAADMLGFQGHGVAPVRVEYVGRAPLDGSDDGLLMATLRHGQPAPPPSLVMLAASKPFLPAIRGAGRGGVPTPPDRPFGLGTEPSSPVSFSSERSAALRRRPVESADLGPPPDSGRSTPALSAFAPVASSGRADGPVAIMSGRGLY